MSDVSNTRVSLHKQSTPGTLPTDAAWKNLNNRYPEGGPQNQVAEDDTVLTGRNPPSSKLVGLGSGWTLPFTLQYDITGAFWDALIASLQAGSATATTSEVTGVAGSTTSLSATGIETGIEVGDIIRVRSSGNVNLGYPRVVGTDTDQLTVDTSEFDGQANLKVLRGPRLKNGTEQDVFSLLVSNYQPGSSSFDLFDHYKYEVMDRFQLSIAYGQFMRGSFTTVGRGGETMSTTYPGAGTPTFAAAPTTEMMDSQNNLPVIRVAAATYAVQGVEFGWQNGSEIRGTAGSLTNASVASGLFRGSGTIRAYYDDIVEWNKALAGTPSELVVVTRDSTGAAYAWSVPQVRYGNPTRPRQGASIITELPFTFEVDTAENIGIRVVAFPS